MPEDGDSPARRGFMSRAPELRAVLVAELSGLLGRVPSLTPDETAVLAQLLAYAGFGEDGRLRLPSFAVLWGAEQSYVPAVALPPERVRAAVKILRRRGLLLAVAPEGEAAQEHGVSVVLDHERLRALAEPAG